MPRRGKRRRLDRCIYEDKSGRSIVIAGREHRYPRTATLVELRRERGRLEERARGSGSSRAAARGTLGHAVDAWASQERHLASYISRRAELRAWVRALGAHVPLSRVTSAHIRTTICAWTASGKVAPKTIRNRLWSLQHLYRVILGPTAETPVDDVSPPAKVRTVVQHVSPDVILNVYQTLLKFEQTGRLRDAKTRARFMVRASTGRRPSEIMRAEPGDVDLDRREWRVRDGKGGWSEGLYLNDDMLIAWTTFAEAKAWGPFATDSMAEVLRAAGWPSATNARGEYLSRPYHLRHLVGLAISEQGIDLADVGGWLGHTDVRTTRAIYAPILNSRMQRVSTILEGRLKGWQVPSAVPRTGSEQLVDRRKRSEKRAVAKPERVKGKTVTPLAKRQKAPAKPAVLVS